MPYRDNRYSEPRRLVVDNHSLLRAAGAACCGALVSLAGGALLPMFNLVVPPFGADVAVSAVGTVLVLAGLSLAASAVRMRRSRTVLAIERDKLTITVHAGRDAVSQHVLRIEDIHQVNLETVDGRHCAQIVAHGGTAVAIGEAMTSSVAHHQRHAAAVRQFLGLA